MDPLRTWTSQSSTMNGMLTGIWTSVTFNRGSQRGNLRFSQLLSSCPSRLIIYNSSVSSVGRVSVNLFGFFLKLALKSSDRICRSFSSCKTHKFGLILKKRKIKCRFDFKQFIITILNNYHLLATSFKTEHFKLIPILSIEE